jgi:hypothetical protein
MARPTDDRTQEYEQEREGEACQPYADALRAAAGLVLHRYRGSYVSYRQYASVRLDGCTSDRKGAGMTRIPLLFMLAAAAAIAGCNKENHTIVAGPDIGDNDANVANGAIQLPPSILATKIYRCTDNTVVTVDYLSDGQSANVRVGKAVASTKVVATEPAKAMTAAGGYSVEGSTTSSTAKIAVPGHSSQSCSA